MKNKTDFKWVFIVTILAFIISIIMTLFSKLTLENVSLIIAVLITIILSTVISTLLVTFIGLFSFIIEDANPFYWLYSKLILILGTIFFTLSKPFN